MNAFKESERTGNFIGDEGARMISDAFRTDKGFSARFLGRTKGTASLVSLNLSGD